MTRYFYGAKEGTPSTSNRTQRMADYGKMNTDPVMDSLSDYAFMYRRAGTL